jgi:hypothetical protein
VTAIHPDDPTCADGDDLYRGEVLTMERSRSEATAAAPIAGFAPFAH